MSSGDRDDELTTDASEELQRLVEEVRREAAGEQTTDASEELQRLVQEVRDEPPAAPTWAPPTAPDDDDEGAATSTEPSSSHDEDVPPRGERWTPQARIAVASPAPPQHAPVADQPPRQSRTALIVAVGTALVLAIILAVVLLTGGDEADAPTTTVPSSDPGAVTDEPADEGSQP